MKHSTKLLVMFAAVIGALTLAAAGWAYFTATGSGAAAVTVGTLNAPTLVTATQPHPGVGTVALTWTAATTPDGSALAGYYVERMSGSTPSAACGSSPTHLAGTATTCDDTGVGLGTYSYTVTAYWRSWTSTSNTKSVTVQKGDTSTAVVSTTGTPSVVGQQVTYTATVAVSSPGSGTPTGNIAFFDGGTAISACGGTTGNPLSGTSATCAVTYPASGSHTITAKYLGAPNFNASPPSPSITQVVSKTTPTIAVVASPAAPTLGQTVVFTATVTGPAGAATPAGTVTWAFGTSPVTSCGSTTPLSGSTNVATATCTIAASKAGSYSVTASAALDTNYNATGASTPATTFTVAKATPTIAVVASPAAPTLGQTVVFTATVTGPAGAATPAGTVTWAFGTSPVTSCGSTTPLSGSTNVATATCTITASAAGNYAVTASVALDTTYNAAGPSTPAATFTVTSSAPVRLRFSSCSWTNSVTPPTPTCPISGPATMTLNKANQSGGGTWTAKVTLIDGSGNVVTNTGTTPISVSVAKVTSLTTITFSSGTALTIPVGASESTNSFTYGNAGVTNGGGSDTVTASFGSLTAVGNVAW
jgi:large repetitive protein